MLNKTASNVIDLYGSSNIWSRNNYIEAIVSLKGLALMLKKRPVLDKVNVYMHTRIPYCRISPIRAREQITGVMYGHHVWLEDDQGKVLNKRTNARSYFNNIRQYIYWDDMDMAYFANYVLWNYFTLPALLLNESIDWTEEEKGVLHASFPDSIPTHSKNQIFVFNTDSYQLSSHIFTSMVISKFAFSSNLIRNHEAFGNVLVPTKGIVKAEYFSKSFLSPTLIDIEVHEYNLTRKRPENSIMKKTS